MRTTTVVIGAGHAGLAMSRCLTERSIDHVVLERGEVANSWKTERWDSLRLLTPNWQSRLPGYGDDSGNPNGFRTMNETVQFIERYAGVVAAPVRSHTKVLGVHRNDGGYVVNTDRGVWEARTVVLATGACNIANKPSMATGLPTSINQLTPMQYRNPDQIDDGDVLVVGGAASGVQIAEELQRSGRAVTLSLGEHVRVPRRYRGRDIKWWMDVTGVLDEFYQDVDSIDRVRRLPSLQLVGSSTGHTLDVNVLTELGVEVVGRMAGVNDGRAQFSGSLRNVCEMADLKMNRLLGRIDEWIDEHLDNGEVEPEHRFEPTRVDASPALGLDLRSGRIKTIIWATGYRPDYSWLDVPVLDRKGRLKHDGGVVESPGMYVLGLPFLRKRKSTLIDGAGDDARALSAHLKKYLDGRPSNRSLQRQPESTLVP